MLNPIENNDNFNANQGKSNNYIDAIKLEILERKEEIASSRAKFVAYIGLLDKAKDEKNEFYLPNSGNEHAAWMYSKMFDFTERQILLVVKNFSGQVSNKPEYLDSLIRCLEKDAVKAKVVILDYKNGPNPESKAFNIFKEYYQKKDDKVKIKIATPDKTDQVILNNLDYDGEIVNWAIFDDETYRLEINPSEFSAIGGFHDRKTAQKLKDIFAEVYDSAIDYNPL